MVPGETWPGEICTGFGRQKQSNSHDTHDGQCRTPDAIAACAHDLLAALSVRSSTWPAALSAPTKSPASTSLSPGLGAHAAPRQKVPTPSIGLLWLNVRVTETKYRFKVVPVGSFVLTHICMQIFCPNARSADLM